MEERSWCICIGMCGGVGGSMQWVGMGFLLVWCGMDVWVLWSYSSCGSSGNFLLPKFLSLLMHLSSIEAFMIKPSFVFGFLKLCTLCSGVADYVNFLTTLYDVIFQWWSYTSCNGDQNFCGTSIFKKYHWFCQPTLMSWNDLTLACYVGCIA